MTVPAYRDYQESGIPGLGEVPTGWSVTRMDKHLRYVKQQISSEALAGQDVFHYSIPVVQVTGSGAVEDGSTIDSSKFKIDRELILISKLNPRKATICRAAPQGQLTVCSTEFVPLAGQGIDLDFVQYILMSNTYRQRLESLVESATRSHQRVAPSDIYRFWWAIPSVEHQRTCVKFLDRETGKIDVLIDKQEQLIATLREDRIATVTQAVSKGLDPDVELKDSGIEWLGEIPASWPVSALKHHFSVVLGKMLQREPRVKGDCLQPYLRAAHVPPTGFTTDDAKQMWFSPIERLELDLRRGDLVVVEGGMGGYGRCDVIPEDLPGWGFEKSINRLRARDRSSGAFAKYVLQTAREHGFMEAICSVSTMPHLTAEKLGDLLIPVPPIHQQHEIVRFLDEQGGKIDALIAKANEVIETMREYRSALITDAVTGKIDVRFAVA